MGGGITCERVKAIKKRIGHRGRVKEQEGGGTKREEGRVRGESGDRIQAGRARKRSEKRVLKKGKAERRNLQDCRRFPHNQNGEVM